MKFTKVMVIINTHSADEIMFSTDLPEPYYPWTGNLVLNTKAASGFGVEYIKKHFPDLEIEIVDCRS